MSDFIVQVSSNLMYAALIAVGGVLCHRLKHLITLIITLQSGLRSVLRNDIMNVHDRMEKQGGIYPHQLENAEHMYLDYKKLGGNGAVEQIMREIEEAEILRAPR